MLNRNKIKIYILDTSITFYDNSILENNLSPDEIIRANKFRLEKDKEKYMVSRFVLRKIIGQLLSIVPKNINILTNKFGKPFFNATEYPNLNFNLSHSGDLVVYAFCLDTDIGIDIEQIDYSMKFIELVSNFFTENEINYLLSSSEEKTKVEKFYRIWTRKEAVLKSVGTGLLPDLKTIDVLGDIIELNIQSSEIQNFGHKKVYISDLFIQNNFKTAIASLSKIDIIQIENIL